MRDKTKERRYAVTARVTPLGDGVYQIVLDAPEDSSLRGAVYKVHETDWRKAAAKAQRYADEMVAESNAALHRFKRFGAKTVLEWQPAILEGMD